MGRVLLSVALILLAAALIVVAKINRYLYFSVVGPSWSGSDTETESRRIDRWTGTPQVWVCQDIDTGQTANVPAPPPQPPEVGLTARTVDAAARNSAYLISLKRWRSDHPNVDAVTLRVTQRRCTWESAR